MERKVSLVIPTWNGRELLERFLPSVLRDLEAYPGGGEVLVVDDGSTDGTAEFLAEKYPQVRLLRLETNRGFAPAVNRGVRDSAHEMAVLLNNDVEVSEDFLTPLVRHFDDPEVFGVGARSLDWDRAAFRDGGKVGAWKRGFWRVWRNYDLADDEGPLPGPLPTFYCPGGFSAFHRRKWLELGGLDELFSPFNWEDTDICYRALKRGWRLVYEPQAKVFHRPNTTIGRKKNFRRMYVRYISRRNRLLFHWKNLTEPSMLTEHLFFLALSLPVSLLRLDPVSVAAAFGALTYLPQVKKLRAVEKARAAVKDSQIREFYKGVPPQGDKRLVLK